MTHFHRSRRVLFAAPELLERLPVLPAGLPVIMMTPSGRSQVDSRKKVALQLCLPLPNGLVAKDDPTLEKHLAEIVKCEMIAQAPEHDQGDDVAGILGPVQHAGTALIELPATVTAVPYGPVAQRQPRSRSQRISSRGSRVALIWPGAYPHPHRRATHLLAARDLTDPVDPTRNLFVLLMLQSSSPEQRRHYRT